MGEAIADKAELPLLDVLLNRIKLFFFGDLITRKSAKARTYDGGPERVSQEEPQG